MVTLSVFSYLTNPISLDAHDQKKKIVENRIYSSNPTYSATGEGVVLKDFVYDISLNPNSRITLDEVFGLYAKKGDITYTVVDAKNGLRNVIAFLEKDLNSRDAQSKSERIATINHYKNLLGKISESDSASLNGLEKAVSDGIIDVNNDSLVLPEGWKIKDGVYVLIAKSKSLDSGKEKYVANSVPIVINLKTYSEKTGIDSKLIGEPAVSIPTFQEPAQKKAGKEVSGKESSDEKYSKPERKFSRTELILDGLVGENGLSGASAGISHGPVAFLFNALRSDDIRVNEVTVPLSAGRYGYGTEDHVNFNSLGLSLELYPVKFLFLGAGGNRWNYTERIEESIRDEEGEIIKSNTNSKSAKEYSARGYLGAEIPIKNGCGLRLSGGYDTKKGIFGGIGLNVKLNKKLAKKK